MRCSLSILALAGAVAAQTPNFNAISNPSEAGSTLTVGQQYDITWGYNAQWSDDSSILLVGGPSTTQLTTVGTITSSVANSDESFAWTVESFQAETVYGFKIVSNSDSTVFQYSFPFYISGASDSDTTTSSSASPSSSTDSPTTTVTAVTSWTKVAVLSPTTRNGTSPTDSDCESYSAGGNAANPSYSSVTRPQAGWSGNATAAPTWTTTTAAAVNWAAATVSTHASAGFATSAKTGTASPVIVTGAASKAVSDGLAMLGVAMAVLALLQ